MVGRKDDDEEDSMKRWRRLAPGAAGLLVAVSLAGCMQVTAPTFTPAPAATPTVATAAITYTDPFAYCASVQNVDAPDARFTGAKAPDVIVKGLATILKIPATMPLDQQARSLVWRCMAGKVYACTVGANLPCSEKADLSKTPTAGMKDFCAANPASDFIPAAVTGRATVYAWRCTGGAPTVDKQVSEPDARGFLSNFWYAIPGN